MYGLSKKQKLNFILEKVEELELSAYEISKGTTLTEAGISRIIRKIAKNPHENSLNQILEFLEKKVLGSEIGKKTEVNEPTEIYSKELLEKINNNPLIICLNEKNELTLEVLKLQNLLRENKIKFTDFFKKSDEEKK